MQNIQMLALISSLQLLKQMSHYQYMPAFPFFMFSYDLYSQMNPPFFQTIEASVSPTVVKEEEREIQNVECNFFHESKQKSAKIEAKSQKIINTDDEWSPQVIRKKKLNKTLAQKQDRNALSNIMRCFLKFLSTKEAVLHLERLKLRNQISVTTQQIIQWLDNLGISHKNYVRLESVIKLIKVDLAHEGKLSKVFVMLYITHLNSSLRVHFLTSSKLKQGNRNVILSKIREIQTIFLDLFVDFNQ